MSQLLIDALLQGIWEDPDNGERITVPIDDIRVVSGLRHHAVDLVKSLDMGKHFAVISDENTHSVLGHYIEQALSSHSPISSIKLTKPEANETYVDQVREAGILADAYIAVGSGTINDIVKYASFLDKKPYTIFGTAPSMNGYASANAAISIKGHKKSLAAQLPRGIFLDLDILVDAPLRLIRSGIGDSICRSTCQADWMLSHYIKGTPYKDAPFVLLQEDEDELFDNVKGLIKRDKETMAQLARLLVLSGMGMYITGGSYPASQGEHLIAHTMEMVHGKKLNPTFHGEQIGVTTLTMAQLQKKLLQERLVIKPTMVNEEKIKHYFGTEIGEECIKEIKAKAISPEEAVKINYKLENNWEFIVSAIKQIVRPYKELVEILEVIGAPVTPEGLGWSGRAYEEAYHYARYIRNRFTFLDIVD